MRRERIAEIALGRGQVGYYDALTNLRITLSEPTASVYAGMNTTHLKEDVFKGKIQLLNGSLGEPPVPKLIKVLKEQYKRDGSKKSMGKEEIPESESPAAVKSWAGKQTRKRGGKTAAAKSPRRRQEEDNL